MYYTGVDISTVIENRPAFNFQNIFNIAKEKNVPISGYSNLLGYFEYLKEFLAIDLDSGEILWDGRFLIQAPSQAQVVPVGRLHGVARREEIPSFVQQSLPAVLLGDGGVAIPHLAQISGVSAKFIRHLR